MICVFVVCFLAACSLIASQFFFRFHARNVSEVIALTRFVDHRQLEELRSSIIEENLRAGLPSGRFRAEQRKRALLLFENLRRMSYNSGILLSWAYRLQERLETAGMFNHESRTALSDALAAATSFRLYNLSALGKLFLRILLNRLLLSPAPKLAAMLRVKDRDILAMYDAMINTAIRLAGSEGAEAQNRLATTLLGRLV